MPLPRRNQVTPDTLFAYYKFQTFVLLLCRILISVNYLVHYLSIMSMFRGLCFGFHEAHSIMRGCLSKYVLPDTKLKQTLLSLQLKLFEGSIDSFMGFFLHF